MSHAPYLIICVVGVAVGGAAVHVFDRSQLAKEQAAHARDNEANVRNIATLSERAAKAASDAIAAHNTAAARIAALDEQFHRERISHEADNAKNRAAIADGTRRLRIAIADAGSTDHSGAANPSSAAGGMGDGASRYAELSPTVGAALFEIVDDADGDARMKATYLQHYVLMLQRRGLITGGEPSGNAAKNLISEAGYSVFLRQ
ncbi:MULTISPECIES: lysis system i-spanin subunit Rz [unclassified Caballeronia]|uniref:lysis system i-spanin subunit Rz n=1 Tax=unclassified Caballeronia TaxID=2646786 RepID=UPI00285EC087|nr:MULTISPECIES: lysis system i-spanin subunit Rz [unclassified Caballeronia]MDR5775587.1 lysis system i-spanin subunit Rz [Caballeronia sp. LZ002]MDR5802318.1 lysis system i-spanin subunit Rz [Caballeronia sp. LZ001]MDR5851025.1 lysis system i-spanin subunit Rz [Caballeronia sp. LZ003]